MATNDFPFIPQNLTIDDNIQPDVAISADTLPILPSGRMIMKKGIKA